jgi:hypothetical protein
MMKDIDVYFWRLQIGYILQICTRVVRTLGQIIECEATLKSQMVGKFGGMIPFLAAKARRQLKAIHSKR